MSPWGFNSPLAHVVARLSTRRRRRALWLVLAITGGALLLLAMGRMRSDVRALAAYLDLARSVGDGEAALAATFSDLVERLDQIERPVLLTTLADLEETADGASARLAATERPPTAVEAHGLLSIALSSWRGGLAGFEEGLLLAVDQPDNPEGLSVLQTALVDLGIGDRAYGRFRTLAVDLKQELDVRSADPPQVRFLPPQGLAAYSAQGLADRARSAEGLALRRDVGVAAVVLEPGPIGQTEGVPVVPFAERFSVRVSVVNKGNHAESEIDVRLVLSREGEPIDFEDRATIDELAVGASTTLTFEGLPVVGGELSSLLIELDGLEGEQALDDNSERLNFYRNDRV